MAVHTLNGSYFVCPKVGWKKMAVHSLTMLSHVHYEHKLNIIIIRQEAGCSPTQSQKVQKTQAPIHNH